MRASERKPGENTRVSVRNHGERDTRVWRERDGEWMSPREEGWIPVVGGQRVRRKEMPEGEEVFTLFVDNIPEARDNLWLARLFSRYGVVRDAFIPNKRSKISGSKFGFIRFSNRGDVHRAMDKLNGIWVDDKRMHVKEASFNQNSNRGDKERIVRRKEGVNKGQGQVQDVQGGNRKSSAWNTREQGKSFVEVLKGGI